MNYHVERLSHEGRGVSHEEGKVVFITGALPEESVSVRVTRKHRRYLEASFESLHSEPHPDRVMPPCQHFGLCGGCVLQHLSPMAQVMHKQSVLLEQLRVFGKVEPETVLEPLLGPTLHYRTKARIGVKYVEKKQKLLIGFREAQGGKIADLSGCTNLPAKMTELWEPLRQTIMSLDSFRSIPQIEMAMGGQTLALVIRHLEPLSERDKNIWYQFAKKQQISVYLQPEGPDSVHKLYPEEGDFYLQYDLKKYQLQYDFHPCDFTQVNPDINQKMIEQTLQLLKIQKEDRVLDLFCGLGNFSLPLAQHAEWVVGVEGDANMVKRATHNAQKNQLNNTNFYQANLFEDPSVYDWAKADYNKILIDPPRSGAEGLMPYLGKSKAKTLVYVSCNPATLARDLGLCVSQWGWQLKACGVMDMFPHTHHVEAIALLQR